jgi:hypothetical protein
MKIRWMAVFMAFVLLVAACSDDAGDDGTNVGPDEDQSGEDSDGEADDGDAEDGSAAADDDTTADGSGGDGDDDGDSDDDVSDDDLGEIFGDPDFDADALPDDIEEMTDDTAGVVSVGPCVVETLGVGLEAPDNFSCRLLDNPLPGFDGFTLFSEQSDVEISVMNSLPIGSPCELLAGLCENETPVDIPGFSDAIQFEISGLGQMYGTHDEYEADLVVTKSGLFSDDDIRFIRDVVSLLGVV